MSSQKGFKTLNQVRAKYHPSIGPGGHLLYGSAKDNENEEKTDKIRIQDIPVLV
jgi:hypothetical protein